jgi:hypothetical protein
MEQGVARAKVPDHGNGNERSSAEFAGWHEKQANGPKQLPWASCRDLFVSPIAHISLNTGASGRLGVLISEFYYFEHKMEIIIT